MSEQMYAEEFVGPYEFVRLQNEGQDQYATDFCICFVNLSKYHRVYRKEDTCWIEYKGIRLYLKQLPPFK